MLNNKIVVVTGGAGLIGRAFVRSIVESGGTAVVADIKPYEVDVDGWLKDGDLLRKVEFVSLDITSASELADIIVYLHEKYGRIDALVNNAYPRNKHYGRKFEDVTYEDFCQNISMHIGGYFLASQQFCKYFKEQGYGSIINMASIYGVIAPRFGVYEHTSMTMPVEYAAIKSAIIHLTKYLAQYFKGSNIRINCISPGGVLNGQSTDFLARYNSYAATKGMLDANDIKGTLLFLLSDMSTFINGQNIVVDDGWSL